MRSGGIKFPNARVMMNLAPADTKKSGSVHDLAIFMGILKAMGYITENTDDCCFIGEVSLNGNIRHVNGVLPMILVARKNNIKHAFVPYDNAFEASVVDEINVYGVKSIMDVIEHFKGGNKIPVQKKYKPRDTHYCSAADFSDIKGQHAAKLALEIAAATGADYTHIFPCEGLLEILSMVQAVPMTLFVDENGAQVGEVYFGAKSYDGWKEIVDSLLEGM